ERHAARPRELRRLLPPSVPALVRPRPAGDAAADAALHPLADAGEPAVPAQRRDAEFRAEARLADGVRIQDKSTRRLWRRLAGAAGPLSGRSRPARLPVAAGRPADQLPDP